jgi:hypothetical protein
VSFGQEANCQPTAARGVALCACMSFIYCPHFRAVCCCRGFDPGVLCI